MGCTQYKEKKKIILNIPFSAAYFDHFYKFGGCPIKFNAGIRRGILDNMLITLGQSPNEKITNLLYFVVL